MSDKRRRSIFIKGLSYLEVDSAALCSWEAHIAQIMLGFMLFAYKI